MKNVPHDDIIFSNGTKMIMHYVSIKKIASLCACVVNTARRGTESEESISELHPPADCIASLVSVGRLLGHLL